ncbi:hypothetical protein C0993_011880 [Termitomyces sp. T159_Od127]|nr:hypothetical protein C0993_011880 [Termitomyces sp. T159_Od127]
MANVFFDIVIDDEPAGKIVMKLYDDVVPKTARNFRELATGEHGFGYKGCKFYRIIPGFLLQAGQVPDGKSIYGGKFAGRLLYFFVVSLRVTYARICGADENFELKHNKPGLLSMASRGKDTNGSEFIITTISTKWLDGTHVVFGEVVENMDLVERIEALGTPQGTPQAEIVIAACGTV